MTFNYRIVLSFLLLLFTYSISFSTYSNAGLNGIVLPISETDTNNYQLYSFYDLRDRESFVQVTTPGSAAVLHIQVFDVGNLCTENNFFDAYTPDDSHIYNMRDVQTNDGNPSGVDLPDTAYGFVVITVVQGIGQPANTEGNIIGNFRVVDTTGYEYRTNSQGPSPITTILGQENYTFNFNILGDVTFSDVVGITVDNITSGEVTAAGSSITFDTTLLNDNEVEFSCSDTTFSCTENTFEYGINDAIPNSRDGDVTCGSNVISEGLVRLEFLSASSIEAFSGYVGLNNGNGRGSMDSLNQDQGQLGCESRGFCRVFVANTLRNGNLGGVSGADTICQNFADGSPMTQGGIYLAWISDSLGNSPSTRFNQVNVPYQLVDGTQVADNYDELISGTLDNEIDLTQSGGLPASTVSWTGTNSDGTSSGTDCNNWIVGTNVSSGTEGLLSATNSTWTNTGIIQCNAVLHLYCFEQ